MTSGRPSNNSASSAPQAATSRVAVPDMEQRCARGDHAAGAAARRRRHHFDYRLAIRAADAGISALRFNRGNIGRSQRVRGVAAARHHGIPIRIGVNGGSVEKRLLKGHEGEATPEMLVESALHHVRILEDENFEDIKISVKSSQVPVMVRAYQILSERVNYPLHLGVTEAGTPRLGGVRSAVGLSTTAEGIGDTLRVSVTADPTEEVAVGIGILTDLGLRQGGISLVSCPTCGRCTVGMISATERVEKRLQGIKGDLRVAVMGTGSRPGEAKAADVAIAYGHGVALLIKARSLSESTPTKLKTC